MLLSIHFHHFSHFLLSAAHRRRGYGRQVSIPVVMCCYLIGVPRHFVTLWQLEAA